MLDSQGILEGLNPGQRAAVETVRGPVCILAGAGSGKTTTITRRIAFQIASGDFRPGEILAVTFTDKAAKEMGERLELLGVSRVRARTFHAEALAQYHRFCSEEREVLASKVPVLKSLVAALPRPHCFVSARDVAAEIEWAKNRRISAENYLSSIEGREPPVPAEAMASIFLQYESRKQRAKMLDFEDLLEETIRLLESDEAALGQVRSGYRAFTVDEYQDVNVVQQALLDVWTGGRPDICVVGDDYQSIFGFTGATPAYLLGFPERHPGCRTFHLRVNYRCTEQVLSAANRLAPRLGGVAKRLEPAREPGPPPVFAALATGRDESDWIVGRLKGLNAQGVDWQDMAVLYRINARSEPLEEALSKAAIPYRVADSPFLRRAAARAVLHQLRRSARADAAAAVEEAVAAMGYTDQAHAAAEGQEATRLADLGRILALARGYTGGGGVAGFLADLTSRFSDESASRGVNLLTYHKAKGKEWDAVFLPRLEEKELPFVLANTAERLAEERRLLYVGITRAKRHLFVTTAAQREGERPARREPSRFLREIHPEGFTAPAGAAGLRSTVAGGAAAGPAGPKPKAGADLSPADAELFRALKQWRMRLCTEQAVPAYVILWDAALAEIAERRPRTVADLLKIKGVGPAKAESFGHELVSVITGFAPGA